MTTDHGTDGPRTGVDRDMRPEFTADEINWILLGIMSIDVECPDYDNKNWIIAQKLGVSREKFDARLIGLLRLNKAQDS